MTNVMTNGEAKPVIRDKFIFFLALLVILGFFAISASMLFLKGQLSEEYREPLLLIIGAWISAFTTIINYFCGSTRQSREKTETIAELAARKLS